MLNSLQLDSGNLTKISNLLLTKGIHNQFGTELCWCFALITVLHNALMRLMKQVGLSKAQIDEFKEEMERTHMQTVNEIVFVVSPRSINEGDPGQTAIVISAFEKVAYPSFLKVLFLK